MRRAIVLGLIVMASVAAAAWGTVNAQQPAPAPAAGRGPAPGVGMIQKVKDNLFMIPGAGGNTVAFVAANGIVLVDTKLANNGQAILDQVKSISDKPITHIINTHTHGDHNGSNQFFPATRGDRGAGKHRREHEEDAGVPGSRQQARAAGPHLQGQLTVLSGNDAIDLYYFGAAHTNGDTFVHFRNARVLHAGDAFANKGQPNIDLANGGSGVAYPDTIGKAASTIKNVDTRGGWAQREPDDGPGS